MRMNSCSFDISRLKKPTVPLPLATCCAMFSTRLVLPIDGRAATMIRSPRWNPRVILSISVKPVAMPVMKLLVLKELLDLREAVLDQVAHGDKAGLDAVVGDREDRAFRLVENEVGFLIGLVGVRQNLVRREDQVAQRRLLFDDARVVLDVGGARDAVDERGDVGGAADLVEIAGAFERVFQRDQIDRLAAFGELDHPLEDAAMRVAEERARVDDRRGDVERFVVDENRAEDRALGVEVVRKRAL